MRSKYDPYGAILEGGSESRYSYEGKEFSSLTEDYDFHFRKYDPGLSIFTQPDSGVQNVYDPQNLNRYSFERRNPYKYVDPDGKTIVYYGFQGSGGAILGGSASGGYYISYIPFSEKYQEGLFGQFGTGFTTPTTSSGWIGGISSSNAPSIILSKQQHISITNKLRESLPYGQPGKTVKEVTRVYSQRVYKSSSKIMNKIKSFLSGTFRRKR